jgi:hypothetical protein
LSSIEWGIEFREANLPGCELGGRGMELSLVFGIGSCRIMAEKKFTVRRRLHVWFEVTVRPV